MYVKYKKGVTSVCAIAMMLSLSGCGVIREHVPSDHYCSWAKPITITDSELKTLSAETLREIDDINQEWEKRCG